MLMVNDTFVFATVYSFVMDIDLVPFINSFFSMFDYEIRHSALVLKMRS
jgi:hypothetical protein